MSLKSLISLKFVLYITGIAVLFFLTYGTTSSYQKLVWQNEKLHSKIELYETLNTVDHTAEEKAIILENIKSISLSDNTSIATSESLSNFLVYLALFIIVWPAVFNYLDNKITKAKIETNDNGELL